MFKDGRDKSTNEVRGNLFFKMLGKGDLKFFVIGDVVDIHHALNIDQLVLLKS